MKESNHESFINNRLIVVWKKGEKTFKTYKALLHNKIIDILVFQNNYEEIIEKNQIIKTLFAIGIDEKKKCYDILKILWIKYIR